MIFESILLGIVQGVTEFLPISSSGHLILARLFMGGSETQESLLFDLIVHLVTALIIAVYFYKDIWKLILDGPKKWALILIGILPAGLIGYLFGDIISNGLRSLNVVIVMLIVGSLLLIVGELIIKNKKVHEAPRLKHIIIMGLFQTLALIPGTSRSGSTLAGGLIAGLSRKTAATYSFLLGLPLIVGVALLKVVEMTRGAENVIETTPLIVGGIATFISGFIAIHFLMKIITQKTLWPFVWYRLGLAAVLIVLQVSNII